MSEVGLTVIPMESAVSGEVVPLTDLIPANDGQVIDGTAADLIRDAYNHPHHWMHNGYANPADREVAFLVGRGWTATPDRLQQLEQLDIPWLAINDHFPESGATPTFWCSGDPPGYFAEDLWMNPDIIKFCAMSTINLLRPRGSFKEPGRKTMEAPNVHYFHSVQNSTEPESWLHTPWINWGTSLVVPDGSIKTLYHAAARSSMLIGLRLLWHLGYREVYMLGCDCTPHQHPFPAYYETIIHHLEQIAPTFRRFGYSVYQTNPDSHLRTFPIMPFDSAMRCAS